MKLRKNDHPGYSFERTPWVLVTGVGPLNPPKALRPAEHRGLPPVVVEAGKSIAHGREFVNNFCWNSFPQAHPCNAQRLTRRQRGRPERPDGFMVDPASRNHKLSSAKVYAVAGTTAKVRYGDMVREVSLKKGASVQLNGNLQ